MDKPATDMNETDAITRGVEQITKANIAAHDAVDKVATKADDAASSVRPFIAKSAQSAHETVDKVTGAVAPAAEWVARQSDALVATSKSAEADARNYIVSHPWQAVWASVGLGYLLGRLARR